MAQTFPVRNPPNTLIKSSHGLQIKVSGETIGAIMSWRPADYAREMRHIFEINPLSSGHPIDTVPGNLSGFTIDVERYDIWHEPFEKVFGGDVTLFEALGNQINPFEVYQYLWHPDGFKELTVYRGCWFNRIGREYRADGERTVMARAGITFFRRDKIL
jgi:hypothetical protein